jgi:hypothetical protein
MGVPYYHRANESPLPIFFTGVRVQIAQILLSRERREPMLKDLCIALTILVTTASVSFAGSELNMQEGQWEITTKFFLQR